MLDYFDKTIEEGDVIMQAHEYGMFFYEVRRDPETTTLLHVTDLGGENAIIHKRPDHIVDLTVLLANFPYRDEVIEHLRSEWKAANGR